MGADEKGTPIKSKRGFRRYKSTMGARNPDNRCSMLVEGSILLSLWNNCKMNDRGVFSIQTDPRFGGFHDAERQDVFTATTLAKSIAGHFDAAHSVADRTP